MHLTSRKARLSLPACLRALHGRTARALQCFAQRKVCSAACEVACHIPAAGTHPCGASCLSQAAVCIVGRWAFFCRSSVLGSSDCKSELLKNLFCSSPWSHSMETWMWDLMIWRMTFPGTVFPFISAVLTLVFPNAGNSAGLNCRGRVGSSGTIFLEKRQLMCTAITRSVECTAHTATPTEGDGVP